MVHGEVVFSAGIAQRVMAWFAAGRGAAEVAPFPELTEREREVLVQVAAGRSNAEIADHFVVSLNTVKTHVSRLLSKLSARDRAQLVVCAYESGLVVPNR